MSRRTIFRMPFPRALAFTAFAIAVLTTVPASAATRQVSRSGTDSGNCLSAPCASLSYAYGQASSGDVVHVALDDTPEVVQDSGLDLVALNDALATLATFDPRMSQVVELRFFGGLTVEETAAVLSVSPETVMRDWKTAKVWLLRELSA